MVAWSQTMYACTTPAQHCALVLVSRDRADLDAGLLMGVRKNRANRL